MRLPRWIIAAAFVVLVLFPVSALAEPITINWWFAHGGRLGEKVQEIVANFNASQSQYKMVATYKGNYHDTMTAGIAAFRSKNPPHILQVFVVGTATMMAARNDLSPTILSTARDVCSMSFEVRGERNECCAQWRQTG